MLLEADPDIPPKPSSYPGDDCLALLGLLNENQQL